VKQPHWTKNWILVVMWVRMMRANQGAARELLGMEGLENADLRPNPPPPETPARVQMQVPSRFTIFAAPHSSALFFLGRNAVALPGEDKCNWNERGD
jgi:hypothetical protein